MKLSRRGLLATLPSLATTAAAAPPQPAAENTAKPTREQDLENARALLRSQSAAIAKVKLPMTTEPATVFKA